MTKIETERFIAACRDHYGHICKSHEWHAVAQAIRDGKRVYSLTAAGSGGHDDLLVADDGDTREDLVAEILYHYEINDTDLPDGWDLEPIDELVTVD